MVDGPSNLGAGAGAGAGTPGELLPRIGARIIDGIILVILGLVIGSILNFSVAWLPIQAFVILGYFVLLDVYRGTTLGKQLVGLRVTGPNGANPTPQQAVVREAFTLVGIIPYIGPLLALLVWIGIAVTINSSPTKQGKHDDLAGGTQVLRR